MKKIGIYDSGCGGFSVINQLIKKNFCGEIFYYGDSHNNPWGNKSKQELKSILLTIKDWFKSHQIDGIYSGCNTTLSLFQKELPLIFEVPVFNILQNTQHFYEENEYTALSTQNSYDYQLFKTFLEKKEIQEIACKNLASLIEKNQINDAIETASEYIKTSKFKSIILGCTHYPLILNELEKKFPEKTFIDPATYLDTSALEFDTSKNIKIEFKTSGNLITFKRILNTHLSLSKYTLNAKEYTNTEQLVK